MSKKAESRLQLKVQKALRTAFCQAYVRKIHGNEFQHAGIADRYTCSPGHFLEGQPVVDPQLHYQPLLLRQPLERLDQAGPVLDSHGTL